jgi:hypothetical protein
VRAVSRTGTPQAWSTIDRFYLYRYVIVYHVLPKRSRTIWSAGMDCCKVSMCQPNGGDFRTSCRATCACQPVLAARAGRPCWPQDSAGQCKTVQDKCEKLGASLWDGQSVRCQAAFLRPWGRRTGAAIGGSPTRNRAPVSQLRYRSSDFAAAPSPPEEQEADYWCGPLRTHARPAVDSRAMASSAVLSRRA